MCQWDLDVKYFSRAPVSTKEVPGEDPDKQYGYNLSLVPSFELWIL
jgi:hypothetical protein